ncbi:triple helix repeat-containing collagen [Reticulomyxa filosa]|uniref:Triple helix repeat-containing collagen n=1 Tax=Reticulomyxa filosa TaxID=46433 RepID=X6PB12_RETFI|nr:triple helix repeat-containing collagen [Reticulomyxa filosa]|eukprot:ETO35259.1 triple helix repeat-containing collagen [Reticulomyxa filosa]
MELSQKLTQMNEYNIKQDQLNKAFVSAERTKSAFRSQRETAEKSLLSLKQEERDMTKQVQRQQKYFFVCIRYAVGPKWTGPEQKDKLKKRIEDVLGEIKAAEMEEQKCYDTEMMLYQQQQQLKNVRENFGNESQLLPIESGLSKTPQKPIPSQVCVKEEKGYFFFNFYLCVHLFLLKQQKGTHEHRPNEELREAHEQHGTRKLPGLQGQSGFQSGVSSTGPSGTSSGTTGTSGISGFGGPGTDQRAGHGDVGVQGTGSRVQGHDVSGVQGHDVSGVQGTGSRVQGTGSRVQGHDISGVHERGMGSAAKEQFGMGSLHPQQQQQQQQSGTAFPSSTTSTSSSRQTAEQPHGSHEQRGPQQERAIQGHDIGFGVQGQQGTQEHSFGAQGVQGHQGTQEHSFGAQGVQGQQGTQERSFGAQGVQGVQGVQGQSGLPRQAGIQSGTQERSGVQGQQHGMQGVQGHGMQEAVPERRLHEQFGTHQQQQQQQQHGQSAMSESNSWEQPLPDAKGTIVGQQDYDIRKAREDARNLRSAMKGAGADRGVIAQIAGNRTIMQRQMISKEYALMEGKEKQNLIDDLRSEITGDLGKLVVPLFMQPGEFDAYLLTKAMEGIGCDSDILIEILCTR